MKRSHSWAIGICFLVCSVLCFWLQTALAETKPTKLKFANWLPPINPVSKVFEDWARDFEKRTGGRYEVEVVHGGALAGIMESYDTVAKGVVDIASFVPHHSPKPFPLSSVSTFPWSRARADLYTKVWFSNVYRKGYLDKEYADVKVIMQYLCPTEDFLTVRPINSMAELKGVKIIGGPGVKVKIAKTLGIVWVFGGPAEAYEMLQKGIAEGIFISGLGLKEFHWDEFIRYLIEPLRMGSVMHAVVMNKATYNRMPADVRAIIDEMDKEGQYSSRASKAFEDLTSSTIKSFLERGGKSINWSPDDIDRLHKLLSPIWKEEIEELEKKGMPAKKIVDEFYVGLKKEGVKSPAVGYEPD
jgi:TRAP-type C4-dicarboxylate transport system substrate-binding protein